MPWITPGTYGNHGSGVAINLGVAASTDPVPGNYAVVPFDEINDAVGQLGVSVAAGICTIESGGAYCVAAMVTFSEVPGFTGAAIQIVRDGNVVAEKSTTGLTLAGGALLPLSLTILLDLAESATVEVRSTSFGAGGVPFVPGRTTTFLTLEAV